MFFISLTIQSIAQINSDSSSQKTETRIISIYGSGGLPEMAAIGASYQISDHFAIGFKKSVYLLRGGGFIFPANAGGYGVKLSYFFQRMEGFVANVTNYEITYLFNEEGVRHPNKHGGACEITIGYDSIKGKGIGILFAIGGGLSTYTKHPPLYLLVLKLGLHWDI